MDAKQTGQGPLALIKSEFFEGVPVKAAAEEIRKLTELDRIQLGSAIARGRGLGPDEVTFEMVEY